MAKSVSEDFSNSKFAAAVIRKAAEFFKQQCERSTESKKDVGELSVLMAQVELGSRSYNATGTFEEINEFLRYYPDQNTSKAHLHLSCLGTEFAFTTYYYRHENRSLSRIEVSAPTYGEAQEVLEIFSSATDISVEVFEKSKRTDETDEANETEPTAPRIFIGHGRSSICRDLKDHLHDQHGYEVEAYETGSRAGHTIRDILDEMIDRSDIAFLVLTAEDETSEGSHQARLNVVHETGLFQGRLGFARAIVLLESGCSEFSNIAGVQQIRFSKGNIRETYGDVLSTLRREFGVGLSK